MPVGRGSLERAADEIFQQSQLGCHRALKLVIGNSDRSTLIQTFGNPPLITENVHGNQAMLILFCSGDMRTRHGMFALLELSVLW